MGEMSQAAVLWERENVWVRSLQKVCGSQKPTTAVSWEEPQLEGEGGTPPVASEAE